MHFYPGLSLADILRLQEEEPETIEGLRRNMGAIRARERLALQDDISAAMGDSKSEENGEFKKNLARQAFSDDPKTLLIFMEALTRRS